MKGFILISLWMSTLKVLLLTRKKKVNFLKFICARNTERKLSHSETCAFSNVSLKKISVNNRQEQGKSRFFSTQKT